ncbi:hypothetical protein J4232_06080 [Candidatus Woesearchaeota archaeon]|nr:hypothetical protein [Candidatus Woesearchaeota archaeon]
MVVNSRNTIDDSVRCLVDHKILVVDNDEMDMQLTLDLLECGWYRNINTAYTVREALLKLKQEIVLGEERTKVIFTDTEMGLESGFHLVYGLIRGIYLPGYHSCHDLSSARPMLVADESTQCKKTRVPLIIAISGHKHDTPVCNLDINLSDFYQSSPCTAVRRNFINLTVEQLYQQLGAYRFVDRLTLPNYLLRGGLTKDYTEFHSQKGQPQLHTFIQRNPIPEDSGLHRLN